MSSSVAKLALPITLGVLADSLLSLISLWAVTRISTEATAAVGLSGYLFFLINAAFSVFVGGVSVVASQALGAGKHDVASRAAGETLAAAVLFSLALAGTAPLWLRSYLALLSQGNPGVVLEGCRYAVVRMLSLPAMAVNAVLSSVYRSAERPWPPAVGSAISTAVGAAAIPVLAKPEVLGVVGAGLASSLASYSSLAVYLVWPPPLAVKLALPSSLAARTLLVGLPTAAERLVASAAHNVYINAVARGGTQALAAHNIGLTIENLVIQPSFAISMAALVEAGRRTGADNPREAARVTLESARIGTLWMSFAALLLAASSPFVGYFFTEDAKIAELTTVYLLFAAASEVGLGASSALFGAIRGMGSVWLPLVISSVSVIALRAVPAQLLSLFYGAPGAWATQVTDMYGRAVMAYAAWRILGARRLAKKLV
ncbi:MAG: MATE family efflux transporter [Thermofilum sp.]